HPRRAPPGPPPRPPPAPGDPGPPAPAAPVPPRAARSRSAPAPGPVPVPVPGTHASREGRQAGHVGLGLRLECVRDERVGREQIQRQLAPARRSPRHPCQQALPQQGQLVRERQGRVVHSGREGGAQHVGRRRAARLEPREQLAPGHRASSRLTIVAVCARVSPSLAGSPAPADAKCGRPPPLPPETAASAAAISAAFTPCATKSSVTPTWIPGRSPLVNSTDTDR